MVWPDMLVTTSPGLFASPSGRFSEDGNTPTTLSGRSRLAHAVSAPITAAPPHMSNFIWSMSAAGLSEIPPASKVRPLPTNTSGALRAAAPR